jgi:hypothetical protein
MMHILAAYALIQVSYLPESKASDTGFSLPPNIQEAAFNYTTYKDLIVLPVLINDSIFVNLILDTGCRNLLLFGKRFEKLFSTLPNHKVQFSGLGESSALTGKLALNNKVSIHTLLGEKIPVVILPKRNLFTTRSKIDGIIGYDIFMKFEIELNASRQQITFRPAELAEISSEYTRVALKIEDTRPIIQSKVFFANAEGTDCNIMLDTGSTLGLLLKSKDNTFFAENPQEVLGRGLSGNVMGTVQSARKLLLETFEINILRAAISRSDRHTHGSVGMEIMKDYTIVLNYCKGYAGFKKSQKRGKSLA